MALTFRRGGVGGDYMALSVWFARCAADKLASVSPEVRLYGIKWVLAVAGYVVVGVCCWREGDYMALSASFGGCGGREVGCVAAQARLYGIKSC